MRGSTGVSTGVRTTPSRMEKHKAVDYLRITGWKSSKLPMSGHHRTASEAPFVMTFRWQADGCPFWLLSVSVKVYCNEYMYGKIMRQTCHWK